MTARVLSSVLTTLVILGAAAIIAGVPPKALTPVVFVLTACAWVGVVILARAATPKPRIGALSERAIIALVIALLGTVACILATNTDQGHPYFDPAVASLLFRETIIAVLAVPTVWLVLYFTGRLGQGK